MPIGLIEQVLKTIRNYDMIREGEKVIVAVSGGPDSVFLLHSLGRLKKKLKIKELIVCNLDHGLRGKESEDDSDFVKGLSKDLGTGLVHKKIDKNILRSGDLSTEEAARLERYKFFKESAKKTGATVIATGHTLDDQAETVLMRLVKGSSLKGAIGIPPVRMEGSVRFIRPLLELSKDEIQKYLDGGKVAYRIDRTNFEPVYFRNVVRREVIPFLERYNPRIKRALFNFAEHLREDFEFIREARQNSRLILHDSRLKSGAVALKLKDIVIQPKALQKEILRDALEKAGGEVKKLSFRHWKELEALISRKHKGSALHLPGGIGVTRTDTLLVFRLL